MEKARVAYGLLSVLFIAMGMCIYLLFRDLNHLVLFSRMPMPEFVGSAIVHLPPSALSNALMHNTAGMLWFVSGILFFRFAWFHRVKEQNIYIGCFYGVGGILEICQLSERVPGTFDLLDLAFMGIGAFCEGLLYNTFVKRRIA